jgi:hypothetical protein
VQTAPLISPSDRVKKNNNIKHYFMTLSLIGNIGTGMQWHSWLRHCATSWKIVGSIHRGVIGIFRINNPACGHTMALGSTQPLTEVSTRTTSCTGIAVPLPLPSNGRMND